MSLIAFILYLFLVLVMISYFFITLRSISKSEEREENQDEEIEKMKSSLNVLSNHVDYLESLVSQYITINKDQGEN